MSVRTTIVTYCDIIPAGQSLGLKEDFQLLGDEPDPNKPLALFDVYRCSLRNTLHQVSSTQESLQRIPDLTESEWRERVSSQMVRNNNNVFFTKPSKTATRFPWNMIRDDPRPLSRTPRGPPPAQTWMTAESTAVKAWWFCDDHRSIFHFSYLLTLGPVGFPMKGVSLTTFLVLATSPLPSLMTTHTVFRQYWKLMQPQLLAYWGRKTSRWELWSKKIGSFEIPKDAEVRAFQ
jgi:hypothetical protein